MSHSNMPAGPPYPSRHRVLGRILGAGLAGLLLAGLACSGGGAPATSAAPQQPAAPAQPAAAAPAADPQAPTGMSITVAPAISATPAPSMESMGEPRYGGIMTLANRTDPPARWDNMRTTTVSLQGIAASIFGDGALLQTCPHSVVTVCPYLAESWEINDDFTEFTFKIRDNVFWHDGKAFTVEDAKFWVDLAVFGYKSGDKERTPAIWKGAFGDLQSVDILDGNRLRLTLGSTTALFLETIMNPRHKNAHPPHLIKPQLDAGKTDIAPQDIGLVSHGPFKILDYDKGIRARVRRFDQWWGTDDAGRELPFLDGIDYAIFNDASPMDAAFRVGRIDGTARGNRFQLSGPRKAAIEREMGDRVWFSQTVSGGAGAGIAFNVLREGPWQDARVRRAIQFWIDKQESIAALSGGLAVLQGLLPGESPFTNPDVLEWPGWNQTTRAADRAEAKRLLSEAGYAGGFEMGHMCRRQWIDRCEFLHAQLADLGVDLKLHLVDDAGWNRGRVSTDYDTQQGTHAPAPFPESTVTFYGIFSENPDTGPKHEDLKIKDFYDRLGAAAGNIEERTVIWREFERYVLLEQAYTIPLSNSLQVKAYRSYVKGLPTPAVDDRSLLEMSLVWLDK